MERWDSNLTNKNKQIYLKDVWVNFQKKTEFNPPHTHDGLFSFVIWINVPYYIKDEHDKSPGKYSIENLAGCFQFQYLDTLGSICMHSIPADKTYENTLIIFPSKMVHSVFPFYSSDDYRISISGNFDIK
jgi:hypothetical protein